jgi:alkylresorcinol/alkylpyrone synthase
MFITGLGTAVPETRYTQAECWKALRASPRLATLSSRSQAILRKVLLGDNGIQTRHLALTSLDQAFDLCPDTLHDRFLEVAPALAERAARSALDAAEIAPSGIDAVLVSTCTGYLCPGLSSYVAERLGLSPRVQPLDLVGHGCGAAMPNLRTASALLRAGNTRRVLSICVEVCSAAFYLDDDPGVLVSACLFGDGAAAAVLSGEEGGIGRRVEWKYCESLLRPDQRDLLRFEQRNGMLRNILSLEVPNVATQSAVELFRSMSAALDVPSGDVSGWILHAGGRNVLDALRAGLGLSIDQTQCSADILSAFGNVSSPFALFVLKEALDRGHPPGWWWMTSFGAGFSCAGAFLRVD